MTQKVGDKLRIVNLPSEIFQNGFVPCVAVLSFQTVCIRDWPAAAIIDTIPLVKLGDRRQNAVPGLHFQQNQEAAKLRLRRCQWTFLPRRKAPPTHLTSQDGQDIASSRSHSDSHVCGTVALMWILLSFQWIQDTCCRNEKTIEMPINTAILMTEWDMFRNMSESNWSLLIKYEQMCQVIPFYCEYYLPQ
jgi:hypothetical protein